MIQEEKETSEFPFSSFEKRNQTQYSQLLRRERYICFAQASREEKEILETFLQFQKEKENIAILVFYFESRKRKVK